MLKFYCFLLGEDYDLLKVQTPQSRRKIKQMGTAMLPVVILWFVIGFALGTHFLHWSVTLSSLLAVFFGGFILIIERVIYLSNGSKYLNLFRFGLGFIIAALGSLIFDEIIFTPDIQQEKIVMMAEDGAGIKEDRIAKLIEERASVVQRRKEYENKLESEVNGTGGTGKRGYGQRSKALESRIKDLENHEVKLSHDIDHLEVKVIEAKETRRELILSGKANSEFLLNIKALYRLIIKDPAIFCSWITLFIFFLLIEMLVVLMKWLTPKSSFEVCLKAQEAMTIHKVRSIETRHESMYDPIADDTRFKNIQHKLSTMPKALYSQNAINN